MIQHAPGASRSSRASRRRERAPRAAALALVALASLGCSPAPPVAAAGQGPVSAAPAPRPGGASPPGSPALAEEAPPAVAPGHVAPPPAEPMAPPSLAPERCGPFDCYWVDSGPAALGIVLAEQPLALGIGEAHALAGSESVASTARRFGEVLLPELRGRASHLVVELLAPDPRCQEATREVERAQQPVTAPQSRDNMSDYVALGHRARALGIEPFVLSPTCDEYRAIAAAGDDAIAQMLQTIARVTSRMLRAALQKNRARARPELVVGYGGALHNDLDPSPGKADWSYGPELAAFTGGRYTELDLIVREQIRDTDVWRALPWYAFFDPSRAPSRWLVMRTGPRRYALFFPESEPLAAP